jgi:hypothetical protein
MAAVEVCIGVTMASKMVLHPEVVVLGWELVVNLVAEELMVE